jgi:DNA-binding response OmpR family regulator
MTTSTAACGAPAPVRIGAEVEHRPRVLVVEDDGAIRALIKFLVQRERWTTDDVSDGDEALSRIQNNQYDAIVLDLMLPGLSGEAILAEVRRSLPSQLCRIVVVTASPSFAQKLDTNGLGAVLIKPFDIGQLMDAVRRCMPASP